MATKKQIMFPYSFLEMWSVAKKDLNVTASINIALLLHYSSIFITIQIYVIEIL